MKLYSCFLLLFLNVTTRNYYLYISVSYFYWTVLMWGTFNKILSLKKFPSGCLGEEWIHGYAWESFHCSPETTTTLWIGCTPIPNKKFKLQKKERNRASESCGKRSKELTTFISSKSLRGERKWVWKNIQINNG